MVLVGGEYEYENEIDEILRSFGIIPEMTGNSFDAALECQKAIYQEAGNTADPGEEPDEVDAIRAAGVLTVALSPDFSPMEFVDTSKSGQDQYVGFDVSLAKYLADYLGVKLDIQAMSFEACQTAVALDAVDMSISGYSWTETRAQNYELSDYYYAGETGLLALVNEALAKAYESGLYGPWYDEALATAASDSAAEVTI